MIQTTDRPNGPKGVTLMTNTTPDIPTALLTDLIDGSEVEYHDAVTVIDGREWCVAVVGGDSRWAYAPDDIVAETGEIARELPIGPPVA